MFKLIFLLFLHSGFLQATFLFYTYTHQDYIRCTQAGNNNCITINNNKISNGACCQGGTEKPCKHDGEVYEMCSNQVDSASLKLFTSPNEKPCPEENVIHITSISFTKTIIDSWSSKNFSIRYCKFKISALPSLNAKIILKLSG